MASLQVSSKKVRIGDLLVTKGLITQAQLERALVEQKKTDKRLGKALVDLGFVSETRFMRALADHFSIPFIELNHFKVKTELVQRLPELIARRYRAIVLQDFEETYLVGMSDPLDLVTIDIVEKELGKKVMGAFVRESEIVATLDISYRKSQQIASLAGELEDALSETEGFNVEDLEASADEENAPVMRLLRSILEDAIQVNASDIHIEPSENTLRVRLRVDGMLQEQIMNEKRVAAALVSRLKIMSGLDISEKRLPQDGRFNVKAVGKTVDVRVSTLPIAHGESVVMRLLDQSAGQLSIDQIGMPKTVKEHFRYAITRPHGLVLITGPTGSGKSTTLYAALNEINTEDLKIITAEDPVEYMLDRICQVQVNPKINLSFPSVLRSALRQDPDIIMVGEMRDSETADISIKASLTGHLVLSTLHTNNAILTVNRLIDMGVDHAMIAATVNIIISQRLVRKVCQNCKEKHELDPHEKAWLSRFSQKATKYTFYHGIGCHRCNNTGYKGRTGIYEMMVMTQELIDALTEKDMSKFARLARLQPTYETLRVAALRNAIAGITSIEEVQRVSSMLED